MFLSLKTARRKDCKVLWGILTLSKHGRIAVYSNRMSKIDDCKQLTYILLFTLTFSKAGDKMFSVFIPSDGNSRTQSHEQKFVWTRIGPWKMNVVPAVAHLISLMWGLSRRSALYTPISLFSSRTISSTILIWQCCHLKVD